MATAFNLGAGEPLSLKNTESSTTIPQYYVVALDPSNTDGMKLPAAATSPVIGVCQEAVAVGETGNVKFDGISICIAGEAFAAGTELVASTSVPGRVVAKTTVGRASGQVLIGRALRAAGAAGDEVPVLLQNSTEYTS